MKQSTVDRYERIWRKAQKRKDRARRHTKRLAYKYLPAWTKADEALTRTARNMRLCWNEDGSSLVSQET